MSRTFLLSLIVVVAAVLGWSIYQQAQPSTSVVVQANGPTRLSEPSSLSNAVTDQAASQTLSETASINTADLDATNPSKTDTTLSKEVFLASSDTPPTPSENSTTPETQETPAPTSESPSEAISTVSDIAPVTCSSFDETGLLAAFDGALAAFIADATATYGDQYENLHYQLSSKSGVIEGEQGTVTTNYNGTVQELSTGQAVSANGTITAIFTWDGCSWQVVDYSF